MPIACPSEGWGAIDRATRFVHLEILAACRAATAAAFLARFPLDVHTILTDNGSEFTDRFAIAKKAKPQGRPRATTPSTGSAPRAPSPTGSPNPSGRKPTAWSSASNRRLGEHRARMPQNRAAHHRRFLSHAERDACLHTLVADYLRDITRKPVPIVPPYSIMR